MNRLSDREIGPLLAAALERPAGERAGYVRDACADRPELLHTIEALLAAEADADAWLEGLSAAALPELSDAVLAAREGPLAAGTRLGAYRIVRELSRGGMGTVYLAERDDGQFEQRVAVKVLRRGLDTDDVIERFRRERQILASLTHPGIARLFDGGATGDGRPWLVMELVEGLPIDEHCDARALSIERRLELFRRVADAVAHAHRHLVVHRDLKPSNILVTDDGGVKLLDFGIATIVGDTGGDITQLGGLPLTPAFASPEQLAGAQVTTVSDVYQLGLLLYLLLSGRLPPGRPGDRPAPHDAPTLAPSAASQRTASDSVDAVARRRALRPEQLRRRLRGDLDAVVLKALRPEPDERYGSVAQLSDDIRRWLQGRPVVARRDSALYRTRKFLRRNVRAVAAAALFVLSLSVYAVTVSRERNRARLEADKAQRVKDLIVSMFSAAGPDEARGEVVTVRDAVDEGLRRITSDLADQPEIEAALLSAVSRLYYQLGLYREAAPPLARAVDLRRTLPPDAALVEDLRLSGALTGRWDPDAGEALLRESLELGERVLDPADPLLARVLTDVANRLPSEERDGLLDRAFAILRASDEDVREDMAQALTVAAYGLPERGEALRAADLHRQALEIRRELFGDDHVQVALSTADLALALERADPAASDTLHARAIPLLQKVLGPSHSTTLTVIGNHAGGLRDRGHHAEAEPLYREALARRLEAYPGEPFHAAYPMHGLGWVLAEQGRTGEAEPLLRQVVAAVEGMLEPGHVLVQVARATLGRCLAIAGRFEEAEPLLLGAREGLAKLGNPEPHARQTLERLIALYYAWGRPDEGAPFQAELAAMD